ncbi:cold shock small protein YmcF [Buttiauxella agrestis]|uniref:cold shock small protein YmcF n=1 Tax=Buttiauxella agrestis TaxID=82977 RepID=UPI00351BCC04
MQYLSFKCPSCGGSQYRTSPYDVRETNPYGAVCIFCKSGMHLLHRPMSAIHQHNAVAR